MNNAERYGYQVLDFGDTQIQWYRTPNRVVWYRGQDIGKALGFTAEGRNMTRHFAAKWKHVFQRDEHLHFRERGSIWLNSSGLFLLFSTLLREDFEKHHTSVRLLMSVLVFVEYRVDQEPRG